MGSIPKYTNDRAQSSKINGETHMIPAKTLVFLNSFAIHKMPRYWGKDFLVRRPSRWIESLYQSKNNSVAHGSDNVFDKESVFEPENGTFIPWSDDQNLPGQEVGTGRMCRCDCHAVTKSPCAACSHRRREGRGCPAADP